ncbi:MAG: AAA family ATPase [Myxococcales bacterium]|nr:AAA family ATPase [Myxococcales bacterium]
MPWTLTISGFGPHGGETAVDIDTRRPTLVSGPSEVGKSTLMDGFCLALWGQGRDGKPFPLAACNNEARFVSAALTLPNGVRMERSISFGEDAEGRQTRKHTRIYTDAKGIESRPGSERDWLARIGGLGQRTGVKAQADLVRLAAIPMEWTVLEGAEGGGRPFRDAVLDLTRLAAVPLADIIAELCPAWRDGDPDNEGAAVERRKAVAKQLDRAAGALDMAKAGRAAAAGREVTVPTQAELDDAHLVITTAQAWARHDTARAEYDRAAAEQGGLADAVARWEAAIAELGKRPDESGAGDFVTLDAERREIQRATQDAKSKASQLGWRIEHLEQNPPRPTAPGLADALPRLEGALEAMEAEPAHDTCPTCLRDGWEAAHERRAEAIDDAKAKLRLHREAYESAVAQDKGEVERHEHELAALRAEREKAEAAAAESGEKLRAIDARVSEALARRDAVALWDRRRRELGERPVAAGLPPEPAPPPMARPTGADVRAAEDLVASAGAARGRQAQIAEDIRRLDELLAAAEKDVWRLTEEHARLDLVVEAVRQAPTIALERQLAALGDLGPVTLVPEGERGGLSVYIDGRPWRLASDGRRVVGDLILRAGFRRALGMAWLPLWVDRVQDVGGQPLPDVAAPLVLLRTTDAAWSVSTAMPRSEAA